MKKPLLLATIALVSSASLTAQNTTKPASVGTWKTSLQTGININQAAFSNNWKAGGAGTASWSAKAFVFAKAGYNKDKFAWDNDLQLEFGKMQTTRDTVKTRTKIADRIFLESKAGYKFTEEWRGYASLTYQSQFAKGFDASLDTIISRFMAPGYLTESFGAEYKPNEHFSAQLGLLTLRQTILTDTAIHRGVRGNYGVAIGKKLRNELGCNIILNYNQDFYIFGTKSEKGYPINLKARYWMFTNYGKPLNTRISYTQSIDHRLDLNLTAKINKYMNVMFGYTLFYDSDQDLKVQTTQNFGLGILYAISNTK